MTAYVLSPEQPRWWMVAAVGLLALLGLLILGFDQGQLLSMAQGNIAYDQNLLHEFVHDARHAAGFPCH